MLKAKNSAGGHLMACHDKQAMQEYLKELLVDLNLKKKEHGTVMSSEANEDCLELVKIAWRTLLQKCFEDSMNTPSTVTVYLADPCVRTYPKMRLIWCRAGLTGQEHEATIETNAREQQLEMMEALKVLIAWDDCAIAWAKWKDALCFLKFIVDVITTLVLEEWVKAVRQRGAKSEEVLLKALMELYQDMPLRFSAKELSKFNSYRKLEEIRRYSIKELKVTRELLERVRSLKEYATGKQSSFQYVRGVPGRPSIHSTTEEASAGFFDFEQAIILDFWRVRGWG